MTISPNPYRGFRIEHAVRADSKGLARARRQGTFDRERSGAGLRFDRTQIGAVIDLRDQRRTESPRLLERDRLAVGDDATARR